ncbi:MAG: hypothetical protein IJT71_03800 [Oscillospiraceae bacterium]|nr:hypothetical protein [Oscillospiraceae bacterium]
MADKMKKTVDEVKQDAAKAFESVKAETGKVAAEVKEQVKPVVEKAKKGTEKAVKATKKTARKAAKATKEGAAKAVKASKRTAAKAMQGGDKLNSVVYVQYQGDEEKVEDLVAAAKAAFKAEHLRTKITDLRLYIKPEERAAYYVVNEKFAGRIGF